MSADSEELKVRFEILTPFFIVTSCISYLLHIVANTLKYQFTIRIVSNIH